MLWGGGARDVVCRLEDAGGGLVDEGEVVVGPGGDVSDGVADGVESGECGDDVGDGFGFDFHSSAVFPVFGEVVGVAEGDVCCLVEERFRGMFGGEPIADDDGPVFGVGVSVRPAERLVGESPAVVVKVCGEWPEDAVIGVPGELLDGVLWCGGAGDGVGLGDVELGQDGE